jgi:hypothetical protein
MLDRAHPLVASAGRHRQSDTETAQLNNFTPRMLVIEGCLPVNSIHAFKGDRVGTI